MPQPLPSLKIKLRIPPVPATPTTPIQPDTITTALLKRPLTPLADTPHHPTHSSIPPTNTNGTPTPSTSTSTNGTTTATATTMPTPKKGKRGRANVDRTPDADAVMGPPPAKRSKATGPRGPRKPQPIAPAIDGIINGNGTASGRGRGANGRAANGKGRGGARSMTPNVELTTDPTHLAHPTFTVTSSSFKEGSPMSMNPDLSNDPQSLQPSRPPIIIDKNSRPRPWARRRVVIRTLDGGALEIPVWCSTHPMLLNHEYPHPTSSSPNSTPAPHDPDALFLLTGLSNDKDFRPYLCTHSGCTKSFTTLDQLASHESKMHGARDVVCGVDGCTRGFATRGQLIKHQKMVHFRRPGMGRRKKGVVAPVVVKSEGKEEGVKIERVEGEGGEGTGREEEEEEEEVTRVKVENGV